MIKINNSTIRFSSRVDNYIKYRPHYPVELITFFIDKIHLNKTWVIADIGSGTGISSEQFLKYGNKVFCVEPNKEMREAAEKMLFGLFPGFISVDGTAENTTLPEKSVDFIISGQAFHWFDQFKSKLEFKRILKKGGYTALFWNERRVSDSYFLEAYESLLKKYANDYEKVCHKNNDENKLDAFFTKGNYQTACFSNFQMEDWEGLKGRCLSSSYIPLEGEKNYNILMDELKRIFNTYNINGNIRINYDTKIYYGKLL